jgi:glutamate racemase
MGVEQPIGVFDSGVGGLSVLHAIRTELPAEHLIYVGDSAYAPYGDRSPAFIEERACLMTRFLLARGSKAVVVACNTATSVAVGMLRDTFAVPIVAIEPAVKPAASRTRTRIVGVLATTSTLSSANMAKLLADYGTDVEFIIQPCPGLADRVEKGDVLSDSTREMVTRYVRPLTSKGADTLVLGCTHYPFLRRVIEEVAGPGVDVIDPATAVARELRRRLQTDGLLRHASDSGTEEFWTTGAVEDVATIVSQLWGKPVEVAGLKASSGGRDAAR